MTNARSIINQAARKINVVGRGQSMPAEEAQDALIALNNMIKGFTAGGGVSYNETRQTFNLTGAISYSIGPGGDLNTVRPDDIGSAFITTGGLDYPLKQINSAEYSDITYKNVTGIPEFFYYQQNTPVGRIYLYPAAASGYKLTIVTREQDAAFADLTTDYDLPEGYEEMLVYNLAVRLAPEYEKPVSQDIMMMAKASKTAFESLIRRNNMPTSNIDLASDSQATGNIYTGWFYK